MDHDHQNGENDEEGRLDDIISQGFAAHTEYDDPFRIQSWSAYPSKYFETGGSQKAEVSTKEPVMLFSATANNLGLNNIHHIDFLENKPVKSLKKGGPGPLGAFKNPKNATLKWKPFKGLKGPNAHSAESDEAGDPEEERLKMLPDCCEFTAKRNEAFETAIDEGRRDMSSSWLSQVRLTPAQQKQLCFSESLLMVEESGKVVGKYYCTISNSKWNGKPCFCVHAGSFGKFSTGLESGTSITSFINYSLKPLQEFAHEWASINSDTIERKTILMKEMDLQMPCKITLIRNGKPVDVKSFHLGFRERENLITEGSSMLLQRLLILDRRTTGSMIIQSLSYTGKVVRAKFGELGNGWENVKGKQTKTWGIRRTVNCTEDEERVWDSLFNKNARLMLRCQPDSPQALIPLWFESIVDFDKNGNFIGSYSPYTWVCDPELYSKYSVKKDDLTHDHRRYMLDHPEVRALFSDYLQSILFRKPQNVLDFTKQFFESFLSLNAKPHKDRKKSKMNNVDAFTNSSFQETSSMNIFGEWGFGEGEWLGEGGEGGPGSFYPLNPTLNYDGLERVDDPNAATEESEILATDGNNTEDDLVVDELGQYISRSDTK